ncbi:peroxisomal acyl-coenzyme A oxidase 1-like [Dysidea avara]|uniref:peroxisomal acyl-coenzyme A oxidase 1-like n=1 Tax=Dysidea avara TaxID=196820 RepID=UPI003317587B
MAMAKELKVERERSTLDVLELTHVWDGGEFMTDIRREMESLVFSDPVFNNDDLYFRSNEEAFMRDMEKSVRYVQRCQELNIQDDPIKRPLFVRAINTELPIEINETMFIPTLEGQASNEQKERWLEPAKRHEIIGAYAQTEMGHGTFIRGLETTATYDPKTQQFDMHSPTLTSMKWWPGALGHTATHAVVVARLITKGKDHGIHHFLVQLRSLHDHKPLPGVHVGDIGTKFGYVGGDNGFLRLTHVKIPRENMLMRHAKIAVDGTYTKPAHEKISYGTMMMVRAFLLFFTSDHLSRAVTIATRYSVVRRQTPSKPGGPEMQILDYVTQQYKLLPQIANSYALKMASRFMMQLYVTTKGEIQEGDLSSLPVLHATSAGLKAFSTEMASQGIEVCRLSCGGMGYSLASGLPFLYVRIVAAQTYEGENTVLYLQTARYLHKLYSQRLSQAQLPSDVAYLGADYPCHTTCSANTPYQLFDAHIQLEAYRQRAVRSVSKAYRMMEAALARGMDQPDAWNAASVEWVRAAKAHCHLSVLQMFINAVQTHEMCPNNRHIFKALCDMFALHGIVENGREFLQDGYMSSEQMDMVRQQVYDLLKVIRKEAVPLVDAFDHRDELLCSVLGRYDGDVYNHLYQWALKCPRNKYEVHPAYHKHLKKLIKPPSAKL